MKKTTWGSIVWVLFFSVSFFVEAVEGQGPMEKFAAKQIDNLEIGCKTELETYCQTVTPGAGRGLACIYAHNDKLSSKCENALYDSSEEFQNAAKNLSAFVGACQADIEKLCSTVAVGEGRILTCLEKNKKKVSEKCRGALSHTQGNLGQEKKVVSAGL